MACLELPQFKQGFKITLWKSKTDFTEYNFQDLYADDTIFATLCKILGQLNMTTQKMVPYVWTTEPVRFKISQNNWPGYHVNPFFADKIATATIPDIQLLSDRILNYDSVNIVLYSDMTGFSPLQLKYYFPYEKDALTQKDIQSYMFQNSLLNTLKQTPESALQELRQRSRCQFMRLFLKGIVQTETSYRDLFETVHATDLLTFIQYYDDINHIYYKLPVNHSIPEHLYREWTDSDKFKHVHGITMYAFLKNSYAKIHLDDTKTLHVMYFIDPDQPLSYEEVYSHSVDIRKYLERSWKLKLELTIERLAMKTQIYTSVDFKKFSAFLLKQTPLFEKSPYKNRLTKNILDIQYKRVPSYGQSLDLYELIQNKLDFEVPLPEIIEELSQYGIEEDLIREYIQQDKEQLPKQKKQFKNLGLLLQIHPVSLNLQVFIDNAKSVSEIQHALYWLRCVAYQYKISLPNKETVRKQARESSSSSSEKLMLPVQEGKLSSSSASDLSLGGAIGKKHQRYFKNMLEKLDPDIFSKSDNYARKCQISDLRQPVGMTLEQKEKIDREGYADGYDNYIVYGSQPDKQHVYMCPKIYCPTSQIPLSYEKYKALGEKCPDPSEEPILLYTTTSWYNDPLRKHYVGFLKEKGYQNLNLPCCFKTPQNKEPATEDSYIIDRIKHIEPGRFGTIPSGLHEFIFPNVPHSLCRNTIKSDSCLLRRGIIQSKDSLLESIAYLLNFENKEALVQHIYKTLDPFTFITLEQGLLYMYFLPKEIPKNSNLKAWLKKHPSYVTRFGLETMTPLQKQRQEMLCESYYRFLRYLKHDSLKNPYLLFDLVKFLGATLVVWNRDSQNIATMRCPYYPERNPLLPYILVMQQDDYYEPLVLADPNKNIIRKIAFAEGKKLQTLTEQCPGYIKPPTQTFYNLHLWLETMTPYHFKTFVLDGQDFVIGVVLSNDMYIRLNEPVALANLKEFNVQIAYWEDLQGKQFIAKESDAEAIHALKQKLKRIGYGYDAAFKVPPVSYTQPPKILLPSVKDRPRDNWFKTKKTILQKLLKEYDTLVKQVPPSKRLGSLKMHFSYLNEPARVAVILEELTLDKENIRLAYDRLRQRSLEGPPVLSPNKKEWVMTQHDVAQFMDPESHLMPEKMAAETVQNIKFTEPVKPLPDMMINVSKKSLPSKWRSKFWSDQVVLYPKEYTKNSLMELFEWLGDGNFDVADLDAYLLKEMLRMRFDVVFEDLSMRYGWTKAVGKNPLQKLAALPAEEIKKLWQRVYEMVWPGDLHLYIASGLLRVSFFVIHKGKDVQSNRGNIEELVAASDFIHAKNYTWEERPVLLLFKYASDEKTHYQYATMENGFYEVGRNVPLEVMNLIDRHRALD